MDATVPKQFQQMYANNEGRSIVDVLDLAVNLKVTAAVKSPLLHRGNAAEESTRSSPELSIDSPVYLEKNVLMIGGPSSEPAAPFHLKSNTDALKETAVADVYDLPVVNLKVTVESPLLHHGNAAEESTRSSPELSIDSPVCLEDVPMIGGPSSKPAAGPFSVAPNTDTLGETSLIDAAVLPIPTYSEVPEYPATSRSVGPRRRSAWKRTKRFVWRSLVNVARRVCFCQPFVDVE